MSVTRIVHKPIDLIYGEHDIWPKQCDVLEMKVFINSNPRKKESDPISRQWNVEYTFHHWFPNRAFLVSFNRIIFLKSNWLLNIKSNRIFFRATFSNRATSPNHFWWSDIFIWADSDESTLLPCRSYRRNWNSQHPFYSYSSNTIASMDDYHEWRIKCTLQNQILKT